MDWQSKKTSRVEPGTTVLVVDDQPEILGFVSSFLTELGYSVLKAASGDDALALSREHAGPIALLLSNIQMPGITGIELATKITIERPDIKVMLMSGYPSGMLVLNDRWHFLSKPFLPGKLRDLVSSIINEPAAPPLDEHEDQGR